MTKRPKAAAPQSPPVSAGRPSLLSWLLTLFTRYEGGAIGLLFPVLCLIAAALLGQDTSWDSLNYHFYNGYAYVTGRMDRDIAVAHTQTWFTPFADVPLYLMAVHLPGWAVSAVLALIGGLNIIMAYALARACLRADTPAREAVRLSLFAALLAFWSPMFVSEIGTTFGDITIAALTLTALYLVIRSGFMVRGYALAGLCLGLALSLKTTSALVIVAFTLATLVVVIRPGAWFAAVPRLFAAGAAALVTFLPLGGLWMWQLFQRYGNPVFPLYNGLFRSPFYPTDETGVDGRFLPHGILDTLSYIPRIAFGGFPTAEVFFTDPRMLLALVLGALLLLRTFTGKTAGASPYTPRAVLFLALFAGVFVALWLPFYAIERYAMPVTQVLPILILAALSRLVATPPRLAAWVGPLTIVLALASVPAWWGRDWHGSDWFGFVVPQEAKAENRLYILYSQEPEGIATLALPASSRFVRLAGNLIITPQTGLGQQAMAAIASQKGEIRTLVRTRHAAPPDNALLAAYGLAPAEGPCFTLSTRLHWLDLVPGAPGTQDIATLRAEPIAYRSCPLKKAGT